VLSVAVPVVIFAGATVAAQAVSPSRGQPLLPSLPSISDVSLAHGVAAEVYLQSSRAGVNQFHVIFTTSGAGSAVEGPPHVTASPPGGSPMSLRMVRLSPGHYTAYAVFEPPGTWRFTTTEEIDGRSQSFSVERGLS